MSRISSKSSRRPPDVCVAAVLGDELHRVTALGGHEGMPRSLGSVYGGSVTRYLGGGLRGVVARIIPTPGVEASDNGIAFSADGRTLLLADTGTDALCEYRIDDGTPQRVIHGGDSGGLPYHAPGQVCIAPDGFVFVADHGNACVQVLTPTLDFHGFVGKGVGHPSGVCANAELVVVSYYDALQRLAVFRRDAGTSTEDGIGADAGTSTGVGVQTAAQARCRWIGPFYVPDDQLRRPRAVCFMHGDRHVRARRCC
jgi:hypothetical protein